MPYGMKPEMQNSFGKKPELENNFGKKPELNKYNAAQNQPGPQPQAPKPPKSYLEK